MSLPTSVSDTQSLLAGAGYVADRELATVLHLSLNLKRPLFLEGEAGVGKTELAKAVAGALGRDLIRLQCYEGLDINSAVYEWNYPKQMIAIRLSEAKGTDLDDTAIYTDDFLTERPVLQALKGKVGGAPVLLIDELDRADEPFEAFLLEVLSDYAVTIPELGEIKAKEPPIVIITSNRTREIHDALKRRCLYHWVDYPDAARELEILSQRVPEAADALCRQVTAAVAHLRDADLFKPPGVAEAIDWVRALQALNETELTPQALSDTLGVVLKYQDDLASVRDGQIDSLTEAAQAAA